MQPCGAARQDAGISYNIPGLAHKQAAHQDHVHARHQSPHQEQQEVAQIPPANAAGSSTQHNTAEQSQDQAVQSCTVSSQLVIPCATHDVIKVGCIWNDYRAAMQPDHMFHHALHKLCHQSLHLLLRAALKEFVPSGSSLLVDEGAVVIKAVYALPACPAVVGAWRFY